MTSAVVMEITDVSTAPVPKHVVRYGKCQKKEQKQQETKLLHLVSESLLFANDRVQFGADLLEQFDGSGVISTGRHSRKFLIFGIARSHRTA